MQIFARLRLAVEGIDTERTDTQQRRRNILHPRQRSGALNRLSTNLSSTCQPPVNDRTTHLSVIACQSTVNHLSITVSINCQFSVNHLSVTCQSTCQSLCQSPVNDRTTHASVISCHCQSFCNHPTTTRHSPVTHLSITCQSSWVVGGLALSIVVSLGEYMSKKPADQHDNKVPTFAASV